MNHLTTCTNIKLRMRILSLLYIAKGAAAKEEEEEEAVSAYKIQFNSIQATHTHTATYIED